MWNVLNVFGVLHAFDVVGCVGYVRYVRCVFLCTFVSDLFDVMHEAIVIAWCVLCYSMRLMFLVYFHVFRCV